MKDLNARLLAAYAEDDRAALVTLFAEAANASSNADEVGFFLTQAHVYALELGHPETASLRQRLVEQGREYPLAPPIWR